MDERVVRLALLGEPYLATLDIPRLPADVAAEIVGLWRAGHAGVADLWREHETELRREAARLGIRPAFPGRRYFAEACAAMGRR